MDILVKKLFVNAIKGGTFDNIEYNINFRSPFPFFFS